MMIDDEFKNERIRLKQIFNQCSSVILEETNKCGILLEISTNWIVVSHIIQILMCNELLLRQNYNNDNGV